MASKKRPTSQNGPGRPSKVDQRRATRIIKSVQLGLTFKSAAACAGISYNCFREWRNRGKVDFDNGVVSEFAGFYSAIKRAEALGEEACAKIIMKASNKTWVAAAWWLERICHKRWGRKDRLDSQNQNANLNLPLTGNGAMLPTKRELIADLQRLIAEMPDEELPRISGTNGHARIV